MSVSKLSVEGFLEQSKGFPVLDVRSPGEYNQAHIPGAYSLPLFSDEQRKIVGTSYKQQSRQQAIKHGLVFFGSKMKKMVEEVESIAKTKGKSPDKKIFLHCWRGGMRSGAVSWLLDLYGFEVYLLEGGYKAYRNWVLQQFEKEYNLKIVGGYTGSGKTLILQHLKVAGHEVIDLEGVANHKGSAFGALGQPAQPRQEMFENLLATELYARRNDLLWIEDESQRIGVLNIPHAFWKTMREKTVYFLDIPFNERLEYITAEYGSHDKEKLVNAIIRIQKRLGPMETKTAIGYLLEDNYKECFSILLAYYDKQYVKGLHNRENIAALLNKIPCSHVDTSSNTQKILSCDTVAV